MKVELTSPGAENPFPGLRPFEINEAEVFFGRDDHVTQIVERLRIQRFLAVVGSSGTGKSSLIRAGLIPWIASGFMVGTPAFWSFAVMRPGNRPVTALAQALADAEQIGTNASESLIDQDEICRFLERGPLGVAEVLRAVKFPNDHNLLILVDQFEELLRFRAADDRPDTSDAAERFIRLIVQAARQREFHVYVVLTMRSEFLGACSEFAELAEAINSGIYLVPRLSRAQTREAIEEPVRLRGATISRRAVNRILNEMRNDKDQLPVMQHAMMQVWNNWREERQNDNAIDIENLREIGELQGSLSKHATEIYDDLESEDKGICETLFRCLTQTTSDDQQIRRPATVAEICEAGEASLESVIKVADAFRGENRSFLMPPIGETLNADTVLDISHEALIRQWTHLSEWVKQEAQQGSYLRDLTAQAIRWAGGARFASLLEDDELAGAESWYAANSKRHAWAKRYGGGLDVIGRHLAASKKRANRRRFKLIFVWGFSISIIAIIAIGTPAGGYFLYYEYSENSQWSRMNDSAGDLIDSGGIEPTVLGQWATTKAMTGEMNEAREILMQITAAIERTTATKAFVLALANIASPAELISLVEDVLSDSPQPLAKVFADIAVELAEGHQEDDRASPYFDAAHTLVLESDDDSQSGLRSVLMDAYLAVGRFDQAIALAQTSEGPAQRSRLQRSIVSALIEVRDYKRAGNVAGVIGHPSSRADAYVELIAAFAAERKFDEAKNLVAEIPQSDLGAIRRGIEAIVTSLSHSGNLPEALAYVVKQEAGYQFGSLFAIIAEYWAIVGEPERAKATLELIKDSRAKTNAIIKTSIAFAGIGSVDEALAMSESIPKEDTVALKNCVYGIAIALIDRGKLDDASLVIADIPRGFSRNQARAELAVAYGRRGQIQEAVNAVEDIDHRLTRARVSGRVASGLVEFGATESAHDILSKYEKRNKESRSLSRELEQRVVILLEARAFENARAVTNLIRDEPFRSNAQGALVLHMIEAKKFPEAQSLAEKIATRRDERLALVAHAYIEYGDIESAQAVAEIIKGDRPGDAVFGHIAAALARKGDLHSARTMIEQLVANRSEQVAAYAGVLAAGVSP